jgi:hypothetical protein
VENPAYWRIVHGLTAYIVGCGPRTKGSKPGMVSACGRSRVSAAVYSGFTGIPSGVCQMSSSSDPLGALFAAAPFHCSGSILG